MPPTTVCRRYCFGSTLTYIDMAFSILVAFRLLTRTPENDGPNHCL